jgi:hypothetical protein
VTLPPSWPGSWPAASADQQLLAPPSSSLSKSNNKKKNREKEGRKRRLHPSIKQLFKGVEKYVSKIRTKAS